MDMKAKVGKATRTAEHAIYTIYVPIHTYILYTHTYIHTYTLEVLAHFKHVGAHSIIVILQLVDNDHL